MARRVYFLLVPRQPAVSPTEVHPRVMAWPVLCGSLLSWQSSPFLSFPYIRGPLLRRRQCHWPLVPGVKLTHSRTHVLCPLQGSCKRRPARAGVPAVASRAVRGHLAIATVGPPADHAARPQLHPGADADTRRITETTPLIISWGHAGGAAAEPAGPTHTLLAAPPSRLAAGLDSSGRRGVAGKGASGCAGRAPLRS